MTEANRKYRGYTIEEIDPPLRGLKWRFWNESVEGKATAGTTHTLKEARRAIDYRMKETEEYQAQLREQNESRC